MHRLVSFGFTSEMRNYSKAPTGEWFEPVDIRRKSYCLVQLRNFSSVFHLKGVLGVRLRLWNRTLGGWRGFSHLKADAGNLWFTFGIATTSKSKRQPLKTLES